MSTAGRPPIPVFSDIVGTARLVALIHDNNRLQLSDGGFRSCFRLGPLFRPRSNIKRGLPHGARPATRAPWASSALSVVSGHIGGRTNIMSLHVEILYTEYNFVAAFADTHRSYRRAMRAACVRSTQRPACATFDACSGQSPVFAL
jgi:hypothetical protein